MSSPADYVLGHSVEEQERLMLQGRILRPYTEFYFRTAGIGPGMSVLDLGSGVGDVALLAADIVGPSGRVLGIDRDKKGIERARQRAVEQGCSSWVSFQAIDLEDFSTTEQFDALVGRYVLLYQPYVDATLRRLTRYLKPGGIVAFHEVDFTNPHPSFPPCQVWDETAALLSEMFRRAGAPPDFGRRLGKTFLDAGLPFPALVAESVTGGARGSLLFSWLAATALSVAPRLADFGLKPPAGVTLDHTLASQLEEAVVALGSQLVGSMQFGAWTRKPH